MFFGVGFDLFYFCLKIVGCLVWVVVWEVDFLDVVWCKVERIGEMLELCVLIGFFERGEFVFVLCFESVDYCILGLDLW